ncbi:MAG TPA: NAD+ synthase [Kineosporiaceae bacterium]|nr:NAD+ synthase [Kineosporiaceae bacterium]
MTIAGAIEEQTATTNGITRVVSDAAQNSRTVSTMIQEGRACRPWWTLPLRSSPHLPVRPGPPPNTRCRRANYARPMPQLRLALAQVNPTVGDLAGNADLVLRTAARAHEAGAHLVVFPETVLTGYPVEDLALRTSFVEASRRTLVRLAVRLADAGLGDLACVVGYIDRVDGAQRNVADRPRVGVPKGEPQNCAAMLLGGRVVARYAKHHLPNYGVFDEFRIFVPGRDLTVVRLHGVDVAIAICEDLWQEGGPVALTRAAGAELLVVPNASPYERDKDDVRLDLVTRRASEAGCPLAYVNLVGGQDDLVFDGDSLLVDATGRVLARAAKFAEELLVVDLDLPTDGAHDSPPEVDGVRRVTVSADPLPAYQPDPAHLAPQTCARPLDGEAEVYQALVLGLRDYVRKNGMRSVVVALSGGIDSALVAAIACDAVGPENVVGISMPSRYSSEHSKDDAADLAKRTGLDYRVIPIAPMVQAFHDAVGLTGIAEENLQARVRGVVLMGVSNQEGHLALTTGNKSELSVGYSTIYGDSVGGFNPVKDVPKTLVWALARWRNAEAARLGEVPPIPENSISKAPSAELRPGQTDQDSLPPYDLLDAVLEQYVEGAHGRSELLADGLDPAVVDSVVTLVDRAEWKRRQSAPGPKISPVAFGRDRRLPITSRWREHESQQPSREHV